MLGGIVAVILAVLNGQGGFIQAIKTMAEIPSDVPVTMGQPGAHTGTIISTLFAVVVSGGCYFLGGFSQISGVTKSSRWKCSI